VASQVVKQGLSPKQKTALFAAVIAFIIALANVFGFNIPVVPTV
jgi:hypothetical protein